MTDIASSGSTGAAQASRGPGRWQIFFTNPASVIGFVIVGVLLLAAIFADFVAPFDPDLMGAGGRLTPPSQTHWFGTDEFGRDILSRIIHGSRQTLQIGIIAVGIALTIGMSIGMIGGYAGGWIEKILMRGVDVVFSFTETLIALAAVAVLGPSLQNAMIAVGIATMPFYARTTYSVVLVEKNKPYFESAIAAGAGNFRLIAIHLLPNVVPTMIVVATLGVSTAILAAAGLSFLGLGAQPPSTEWGLMLASSRDYISRAPWTMFAPGLSIALTVLGFNLLGDGAREALDPRQTGG